MAPPPPPTPATGNFHQQLHQQPSAIPPPPTGQNIAPSGAFPGSLTPGWNDPPPVSADALTSNANNRRPRLDLRKRVAHPLDGKSGQGPPSLDASSPRPVAMVPPQRQLPYPDPHNMAGGAADAGTFGGAANANAMRLPPLAQAIGIDPSKVPVAMVPPRQK
ncbi:WAS/WASL-interacting protein family member 1 [Drosophila ficusphila]|uniref:WAS/WASL-interacting protein family member 1 n=1 Tax=Drosophila ficusphila TaxID=30025 RepID=UPI0007E68E25|nr:WAS/WASL-interacting protein family member 1 [Drosophila ficusphila]